MVATMNRPPILPKGVVKNSPSIYSSLERFKTEPLSIGEISELWKVYTTTNRRLLDPTAERLENYWWRIWGSRSRHLKAAIVVQIFADISEGQSFVPLTSQANRDEGPPPTDIRPLPRGASSTTAIHRSSASKLGTTPKQTVPPPSILKGSDSTKRARNSSASKPTARFISPHESEEEEEIISPKTPIVIHPPSPVIQEAKSDKKLMVPNAKKKAVFVAGARGKRPVVVRRQSSQSSTDGSTRTDTQVQSSADRTPPNFTDHARELARQRGQILSLDNSSSSSGRTEKRSSLKNIRAVDKKSLSPRKLPSGGRKSSREETSGSEAGSSRQVPESEAHAGVGNLTTEELEEFEVQRLLLAQANARVLKEHTASQTNITVATQPQHEQSTAVNNTRLGNVTANPAPLPSKSAVCLAPTLATAVGHNNTESLNPSSIRNDKGKGREVEARPSDDMFSKRPLESFSAASVPQSVAALSRSKSQLTLLLEKDRAKINERSASSVDLKSKQKR